MEEPILGYKNIENEKYSLNLLKIKRIVHIPCYRHSK